TSRTAGNVSSVVLMVSACVTPSARMRSRIAGKSACNSGKSRWQWESTSMAPLYGAATASRVHPRPRERQRRAPRLDLLRREDLVDRHPPFLERVRASREIEAPDAGPALVGRRDRLIHAAFEARAPEGERLRVVRSQAFDVVDLQLLVAHV